MLRDVGGWWLVWLVVASAVNASSSVGSGVPSSTMNKISNVVYQIVDYSVDPRRCECNAHVPFAASILHPPYD